MADPRYLKKRNDIFSFVAVTSHVTVVMAAPYVSAVLGVGWHIPVLWVWFGLSMNGLLNLMHECAHGHVFTHRRGSDFLGRWIIAPLVFTDFDGYRQRHWEHHRHVGRPGETKYTYLIDIRRWGLLRTLLRCLALVEAVGKFIGQTKGSDAGAPQSWKWAGRTLLVQAVFGVTLLMAAKHFGTAEQSWAAIGVVVLWAYGVVYLYGLMSVTVFMASLRAIAEHQQYGDDAEQVGYAALRNFTCNPLSRYLMGAYGFEEHSTHHRVPGIPYYNLKSATRDLSTCDRSLCATKDYFEVILEIVRR